MMTRMFGYVLIETVVSLITTLGVVATLLVRLANDTRSNS